MAIRSFAIRFLVFVEQGPVDFLLSVGGDFCKDEEESGAQLIGFRQPDVFYHYYAKVLTPA